MRQLITRAKTLVTPRKFFPNKPLILTGAPRLAPRTLHAASRRRGQASLAPVNVDIHTIDLTVTDDDDATDTTDVTITVLPGRSVGGE